MEFKSKWERAKASGTLQNAVIATCLLATFAIGFELGQYFQQPIEKHYHLHMTNCGDNYKPNVP